MFTDHVDMQKQYLISNLTFHFHFTITKVNKQKMLKAVQTKAFVTSFRQFSKLATAQEVLQQRDNLNNLTQLNNGLRVASYINNRPTATVGIWIDAGSRNETNENNGVATVFEHLVHTGSSKRSSQQVQKDLAKFGANLRSFTTRNQTAFFVECLSKDVDKVVDILADLLLDTNIETTKLEEQRANAIKRAESFEEHNHKGVVMDYLHMTAFQGTPMANSPIGNSKALNSLTQETVKDYAKDMLKPCRMVLACAGGDIDHGNIHKTAEKHFGHLDNTYHKKIPSIFPPTSTEGYSYIPNIGVRFTGSEFLYRDDNYPYIYGAIAVEGVPRGHSDYLAMEIAKTYVGQWDRTYAAQLNAPSSIVQKATINSEIMEFDSFNISYDNTGLFGVYFVLKGTELDACQQAIRPMQRGWKHLAKGATNSEIDRAKNSLRTNLFSQLETNTQLANYVATEVLSTNQIVPLDVLESKIHFISADIVREAVDDHVYDREVACAGIGRVEAWPLYQEIRYAMSWWRL